MSNYNWERGISVVICCFNSAWIIDRCLLALQQQLIKEDLDWEIVLIDNNCTDNTVEVAENTMKGSAIPFKIIKESKAGLAYARRTGINNVKFSCVIFCDDDNLLCPEYVQTMYDILQSDSSIGAVGGKGEAEFQSEPAPIVKANLDCYAVGSQLAHKDWLYGAGLALRTALVKEVYETQHCYLIGRKGDMLLSGDDSELVMSMVNRGYKVHPTDDVQYIHVLKANRLTEEYYKRLYKGLMLPQPVFTTMRCAIYQKPFSDVLLEFYYAIKSLLWSCAKRFLPNSLEVRERSINIIRNYNFWGVFRLWKIYREWAYIKKAAMANSSQVHYALSR